MAVQTQIQTRRGTAASWTSTNPTLAAGEIGFETDTGKFKIGNGSTAWASLAYATNGSAVSPLTTKGDLYTYSTADARLAVGANGETLVADSSTSTGLRYQATTAAGKNAIINGGMDVWQRGTSGTTRGYNSADRYFLNNPGVAGRTYSRQASDLTGFQYFMRMQRTAGSTLTDGFNVSYNLESADSYRFAGQTVTLSWWMRKGATYSGGSLRGGLYSGTGTDQNIDNAYTGAATVVAFSQTPTTSWVRYSITGTVSSSATELAFSLVWDPSGTAGATDYLDLTGFQLEIGSVATQFMRTGGNIQGELAACQRYYYVAASGANTSICNAAAYSTNNAYGVLPFKVSMRTAPTLVQTTGTDFYTLVGGNTSDGFNSFASIANASTESCRLDVTSGITSTQLGAYWFIAASASASLAFSAEL